jgi:hypothetical protein
LHFDHVYYASMLSMNVFHERNHQNSWFWKQKTHVKQTLTQMGNVWDSKRGKLLIRGFCFCFFQIFHTCGLTIIPKRNEPNLARGIQDNQFFLKMPSFGDLHEIIIKIWWLLAFFPRIWWFLNFFCKKNPLFNLHHIYFRCQSVKNYHKKNCSQDLFPF